jgi:hypothetical protein
METEEMKSYVVPALAGAGILGALYYFTRPGEVVPTATIAKKPVQGPTQQEVVARFKKYLLSQAPADYTSTIESLTVDSVEPLKLSGKYFIHLPDGEERSVINPFSPDQFSPDQFAQDISRKMRPFDLTPNHKVYRITAKVVMTRKDGLGSGSNTSTYNVLSGPDGKLTLIPYPSKEEIDALSRDDRNDRNWFGKAMIDLLRPVPAKDLDRVVAATVQRLREGYEAMQSVAPSPNRPTDSQLVTDFLSSFGPNYKVFPSQALPSISEISTSELLYEVTPEFFSKVVAAAPRNMVFKERKEVIRRLIQSESGTTLGPLGKLADVQSQVPGVTLIKAMVSFKNDPFAEMLFLRSGDRIIQKWFPGSVSYVLDQRSLQSRAFDVSSGRSATSNPASLASLALPINIVIGVGILFALTRALDYRR